MDRLSFVSEMSPTDSYSTCLFVSWWCHLGKLRVLGAGTWLVEATKELAFEDGSPGSSLCFCFLVSNHANRLGVTLFHHAFPWNSESSHNKSFLLQAVSASHTGHSTMKMANIDQQKELDPGPRLGVGQVFYHRFAHPSPWWSVLNCAFFPEIFL